MLWCSKQYVQTFDDIIHHNELVEKLKRCKYINLINTVFFGVKGSGKKSIVQAYLNHLITNHFNITVDEIYKNEKEIKCKTSKKLEVFKYTKTKYYYMIDMIKLGKKRIYFFDQFLKYIIQSKNILNMPFNVIVILNYDVYDIKIIQRMKLYSEKYYNYTRFICVTNQPKNLRRMRLNGYANVRVPRQNKKDTIKVIKQIIKKEKPSVKTHTLSFEKKIEKVLEYSENNLAKSIFYAQLLFEFGLVQLKNIALREHRRFEYIFSLITSNNIKNLQDMNKERNTTKLTEPTTLKMKRLIYQCTMNIENYEDLITRFIIFLIKHKTDFFEKYNRDILKLIKNIFIGHTNTNKTTFIITECFFIKIMTIYYLDTMKIK